jgi:hypothetical protein
MVALELAGRLLDRFAVEQILDHLRFADIGHGDDLDIIFFQRKVIEMPPDQAQAHNADSDFPVMHRSSSPFRKTKIGMLRLFYTPEIEKAMN